METTKKRTAVQTQNDVRPIFVEQTWQETEAQQTRGPPSHSSRGRVNKDSVSVCPVALYAQLMTHCRVGTDNSTPGVVLARYTSIPAWPQSVTVWSVMLGENPYSSWCACDT